MLDENDIRLVLETAAIPGIRYQLDGHAELRYEDPPQWTVIVSPAYLEVLVRLMLTFVHDRYSLHLFALKEDGSTIFLGSYAPTPSWDEGMNADPIIAALLS